jgi:hypothetical protein
MTHIISTGDIGTFDPALRAFFAESTELIKAYHERDAELEADRRVGGMKYLTERNPSGDAYMRFREQLAELFKARTVRCWHYTRLTDDEIADIRAHGVTPGSIASMEARVARQVKAGRISAAEQAAIIAGSPLCDTEQAQIRVGQFWVTDRALHPSDDGVELLLGHWGGEVVYFWLQDDALIERLQGLGAPVVLELAVPVALTRHALSFAESALSSVVEALGYPRQMPGIDAYLTKPLGPDGIIKVYTPDDAAFHSLGAVESA